MPPFNTIRRLSIHVCLPLLAAVAWESVIAHSLNGGIPKTAAAAKSELVGPLLSDSGHPPNSAEADESTAPEGGSTPTTTIPLEGFEKRRPANFFRLHINLEPMVCDPLFRSLNVSYEIKPDDRPSMALLHNEFLMSWREKKYVSDLNLKQFGTTSIQTWPQIVGDLDGDGNTDAVYRTSVLRKEVFVDALYFSASPRSDELSDEVLSAERYWQLHGEILRDPSEYPRQSNEIVVRYERLRPYLSSLRGINGDFQDVVQIHGKQYLLTGLRPALTDPKDPTQIDPKYLARATLLSMHHGQYFEPKCQFIANSFLVREGR